VRSSYAGRSQGALFNAARRRSQADSGKARRAWRRQGFDIRIGSVGSKIRKIRGGAFSATASSVAGEARGKRDCGGWNSGCKASRAAETGCARSDSLGFANGG